MRARYFRFLLVTLLRFAIAAISALGLQNFQLPPLLEFGKVQLSPSVVSKTGSTSNLMPSVKLTTTTCPSPAASDVGYVFCIDLFMAWRSADCPLPAWLLYW